jgi:hypothetical protein
LRLRKDHAPTYHRSLGDRTTGRLLQNPEAPATEARGLPFALTGDRPGNDNAPASRRQPTNGVREKMPLWPPWPNYPWRCCRPPKLLGWKNRRIGIVLAAAAAPAFMGCDSRACACVDDNSPAIQPHSSASVAAWMVTAAVISVWCSML